LAANAFLTVLVEKGLMAFVVFVMIWYILIKTALKLNKYTFNIIALPLLAIYFLFNHYLNNILACFLFYVLFLDYYLTKKYL